MCGFQGKLVLKKQECVASPTTFHCHSGVKAFYPPLTAIKRVPERQTHIPGHWKYSVLTFQLGKVHRMFPIKGKDLNSFAFGGRVHLKV